MWGEMKEGGNFLRNKKILNSDWKGTSLTIKQDEDN